MHLEKDDDIVAQTRRQGVERSDQRFPVYPRAVDPRPAPGGCIQDDSLAVQADALLNQAPDGPIRRDASPVLTIDTGRTPVGDDGIGHAGQPVAGQVHVQGPRI